MASAGSNNPKINAAARAYSPRTVAIAAQGRNDDPSFVKIAVQNDSNALQYASWKLRDDHKIVKLAVEKSGGTLPCASYRPRDDPEVVKCAVQNDGRALKNASERLRDDPEVVKLAVQNNGHALEYASERLRDDPEVMRLAVQDSGNALQDASERLRDDPEVVSLAVQELGPALQYASKRLQNHSELTRAMMHVEVVHALRYPAPVESIPSFIRTLANVNDVEALMLAPEQLRNDPDVVKIAVQQSAKALKFASQNMRNDPEIVKAAVRNDGSALLYVHMDLRNDPEIVKTAAFAKKNYGNVRQYASLKLQREMGPMLVALADIRLAQETHNHRGALAVLEKLQPPLNQHPLLLHAAGLLGSESAEILDEKKHHGQIILSVKFDLHAHGSRVASAVYEAMSRNSFLEKFMIYLTNTFSKDFCGDMNKVTVLEGHCFGGCERKCCEPVYKADNGSEIQFGRKFMCKDFPGEVTTHSCWAWSFRWHLRRAAQRRCGLMVQIQERDGLGQGQQIETRMAGYEGLKVLRIEVPEHGWADDAARRLAEDILRWRARGCDKQFQVIKRGDY